MLARNTRPTSSCLHNRADAPLVSQTAGLPNDAPNATVAASTFASAATASATLATTAPRRPVTAVPWN